MGEENKMREKAVEPGFVWIPTGHDSGKESGMVGYWHGEMKDKRPLVEFEAGTVAVNPAALYIPTESEIDDYTGASKSGRGRIYVYEGKESYCISGITDEILLLPKDEHMLANIADICEQLINR